MKKDPYAETKNEGIIDTFGSDVSAQQGPSKDPTVSINGQRQPMESQTESTGEAANAQQAGTDLGLGTETATKKFAQAPIGTDDTQRNPQNPTGPAEGTQYDWLTQGQKKAETQHQIDVLQSRTELQQNRQTLNQQAQQYQTEADMAPYVDAQNAEKVGWTGGYVLDQKRQTDYLKASIQAQLYGAMELQKYGYDSALAAARLSYDLNMQTFAQEYYKDAVSIALQEAQLTGTYIPAEYRDMISQYNTAKAIAADDQVTQEEKDRASRVIASIDTWLKANGVTPAAFEAMNKVMNGMYTTMEKQKNDWTLYDSIIKAGEAKLADNPSYRFVFDEDGNIKFNETTGQAEIVDLDLMKPEEIAEYLKSKNGRESYYSYAKAKVVGTITSGFIAWGKGKGYLEYDKDGNLTNTTKNTVEAFKEYLQDSNVLEQFAFLKDEAIAGITGEWKYRLTLPDGTAVENTYGQLEELGKKGNDEPQNEPGVMQPNSNSGTKDNATIPYVLNNWDTYATVNEGKPKAMTYDELYGQTVGGEDGRSSKQITAYIEGSLKYMKKLIDDGKIEDGTLFKLQRPSGRYDTYLVLYYQGSYYLVSSDDREREAGEGDPGEGETYRRYESYVGPKYYIRGQYIVSNSASRANWK